MYAITLLEQDGYYAGYYKDEPDPLWSSFKDSNSTLAAIFISEEAATKELEAIEHKSPEYKDKMIVINLAAKESFT
jgi:ABC-type enterochelin transport system substrate-binding protein